MTRVLLSALSSMACWICTAAYGGALTIDDLLRAQDLGEAAFSPDGKWIAFERIESIAGNPAQGLGSPAAARTRVFVAQRAGGEPQEILGRHGARYRLAEGSPWGPEGKALLLVETVNGVSRGAFWNARTREVRSIEWPTGPRLTVVGWVDGRAVYAGVAESGAGPRVSNRAVLEQITGKWSSTWSGSAAQVTVSSNSPLFEATQPPPETLILADPATGKAVKIADGDYVALFPSPDGKRFAALRSAEDLPEPLSPFGRRTELQLFELGATGAKLASVFGDFDAAMGVVAWSHTGDRLLVGGKLNLEPRLAVRLFVIDARTGARAEIPIPKNLSLFNPDVSFGGAALLPLGWIADEPVAIMARKAAPGAGGSASVDPIDYGERSGLRFDLYALDRDRVRSLTDFARDSVRTFLVPSDARFALVVGDGALWKVSTDGAHERIMAPGTPAVLGFAAFSANPYHPLPTAAYFESGDLKRAALVAVDDRGIPQPRVLDLRNRRFLPPPARPLSPQAARQTMAAPDLVTTLTKETKGWESRLVLRSDDGERTLVSVNSWLNSRTVVSPVERFTFEAQGRDLTGWIVLPPGERHAPAPAIVSLYGGLMLGPRPPAFALPGVGPGPTVLNGQLWAAQGYAVIFPSAPIGSGADTDVMATLAEQAVAAVEAAAAKGWVDPERVAVIGHSFGGFSAAAVLAKRSDRFRAGISLSGIYDYLHAYGTKPLAQTLSDDGRDDLVTATKVESAQIRLGKPFWQDPAPYIRNSPIFHVEDIDSPLLLLHGDLDLGSTGLPGAERMYNALVRAGKTTALVHYWGEGHILSQEGNIRDQWSRMTRWIETYLGVPAGKAEIGDFGLDLSAAMPDVKPGDDFFRHANGHWLETFELPPDRAMVAPLRELAERSREQTREIIESAARADAPPGSPERRIADYFAAFTDQASIDARGLEPVQADLARIAAARTHRDIARLLGTVGYASPVQLGVQVDRKDPDRYALLIAQGRLGLPDREYYLSGDRKFADIRSKYAAYVEQILVLAEVAEAGEKARAIVALETALARAHWPIERRRDVEATYNPLTKAELIAYAPGLDWRALMEAAGIGDRERFIVGELTAIRDIARVVERTPVDTLKGYLTFRFLSDNAAYLPTPFDDASFALYGRTLRGQPQQEERWKRGVDQVNRVLGELVGRIYVQKHFPPASKAKMEALVSNLRTAMQLRIGALEWMTPATKRRAQEKLAALVTKIGYPQRWKDYSGLEVRRDDPLGNRRRARLWEWEYDLTLLDQPVDRQQWLMSPQTANAYYNPTGNEMVFPAAILQPPFFDPDADPAVNYGAIGAVIGHEISHGFDDQGRKFAADGSLEDWWTEADSAAFTALSQELIEQYSAFDALPGLKLNGAATVGENIADLVGVVVAYNAYRLSLGGREAPVIGGLTGDQRFFLSWAQAWRAKLRDEVLRQMVMTDVHSPPYFRVNGVVRNIDAWYDAFDVQPGDKLYLKPEDRVSIW